MGYVELMNRYPVIIPYLDMPIQHASNRVLGYMRRAEKDYQLESFYKQVREIRPDIALRTTLLLGHPGEGEGDFKKLKNFVKKICFDRLGSFVYSDEEGTIAFRSAHKIAVQTARRRRDQIMKIQQRIALLKNEQLLESVQLVLIDTWHEDGKFYTGRTYRDAPEIDNEVIVRLPENRPDLCGTFQPVRIDDVSEYELYGSLAVNKL
jgi:ribosomal protein S12 methylthiotransferase